MKLSITYAELQDYVADHFHKTVNVGYVGAPDKPCGVGRADANPKLLLNDT